jgi:VWFA-related protein
MRLRGSLLIVWLGISAGAIALAQQQQPPATPATLNGEPAATFKSEVGIIEIDAVVSDKAGNFVRDLMREDFQIFEDGRPRPFSLFSLVDKPVTVAAARTTAPESDVRTLADSQNGRLYAIVLDDLHTAPLRTTILKAAAKRFVEQYLYPGDLAAVLYTGAGQGAGQPLTSSRRLLLAAIDRFRGQQIDSAADGRLETARQRQLTDPNSTSTDPLTDPNEAERRFNAQRTLNALRDIARWMEDIQGRRKSVIFFSEGIDYDMTDIINSRGASGVLGDAQETIGSAARSNVSIYSIDPRGLSGLSDDFINLIEPQNNTTAAREQLGTRGIERDLRTAQDNLRMLADQTGGLSLVNSNDFGGGFERIVRDNSSYYVLGYYAQPNAKAGVVHKLDVRVRRPGLQVRARRQYVMPDARARDSQRNAQRDTVLADAVRSPLPAGNLPMSVFAAPFKGTGKNASVVIAAEVSGAALKFQERSDAFVDDIDFSVVAVGRDGRVAETDSGKTALVVKPEVRQRIAQNGVRFLSRIALPPAAYQLRVAARETGGGAASVVHYDVDIPDFSKDALAMSGLILTTASAGETATPRVDSILRSILPAPPTAARTFTAADTLDVYAEIYDNVPQSHTLDIETRVRPASGADVFSSHRDFSSETSTSGRTFPFGVEIPLRGIPAGSYILRVEARSRLAGTPPVVREIPFTVR